MTLKWIQVLILAGVFLIQYLFEHLFPQDRKINNWKNEQFNIKIGILNLLLNFFPASLLVYILELVKSHKIGLFQQVNLPQWTLIIITIIIMDFWMYLWHWMNHSVPFLWKFHRFHHRDEKMNSTTAIRFHIVELLLSIPGKAIVYILFGFSFIPVIIYEVLFFASIVIHHSNISISEKNDAFYRILFSSPRMHRIHHSRRNEETNSNYGSLFSIWDKIFHSYKSKPAGEILFGTDD
jgi:sterol desaturase/sphingolipid hydroxylase (fatty acid hydroxylase superfamily)